MRAQTGRPKRRWRRFPGTWKRRLGAAASSFQRKPSRSRLESAHRSVTLAIIAVETRSENLERRKNSGLKKNTKAHRALARARSISRRSTKHPRL